MVSSPQPVWTQNLQNKFYDSIQLRSRHRKKNSQDPGMFFFSLAPKLSMCCSVMPSWEPANYISPASCAPIMF